LKSSKVIIVIKYTSSRLFQQPDDCRYFTFSKRQVKKNPGCSTRRLSNCFCVINVMYSQSKRLRVDFKFKLSKGHNTILIEQRCPNCNFLTCDSPYGLVEYLAFFATLNFNVQFLLVEEKTQKHYTMYNYSRRCHRLSASKLANILTHSGRFEHDLNQR
jgi:hypothetical protein